MQFRVDFQLVSYFYKSRLSSFFLFYFSSRKQRSRSVDHILTDPTFTANFEVSPQTGYRTSHGENESRRRSPTRSSITDEDSGEFESVSWSEFYYIVTT